MEGKVFPGMRIEAPFHGSLNEGIVCEITREAPDVEIFDITRTVDTVPVLTSYQIELASWMAEHYMASLGESLYKMLPAGRRQPAAHRKTKTQAAARHVLNEEQAKVFGIIKEEIGADHGGKVPVHLIHGITGSGKTEIYIHLILETLARGKGAILLVPEISLTVQMVSRLEEVFRGDLALLHSALTGSVRFGGYISLLRQEKRIAGGTRSAVFAPVKDPGIIIIDEEHDGSYREHSAPRYDARQVAWKRCQDQGAILVLGSATPRLESRAYALRNPQFYHTLAGRATGARLAKVEIVPSSANDIPVSPLLADRIDSCLKKKEQVLLLLNRRGYIPYLYCKSCQLSLSCPNCSVTLNLHNNGMLVCHYCSFSRPDNGLCDRCGSKVRKLGSGTQKLEEYLLRLFPDIILERLDTDSSAYEDVSNAIRRFVDGEIQILVGTQMIAKGLDAPNVTLVGVLQADQGLYMPDFRAAERTFSLLTQVAGRSGRGSVSGSAIFEALNPENPILQYAARQDYEAFYDDEIKNRKALLYPPFSRVLRLLVRSEEESESQKQTERLAGLLKDRLRFQDPATGLLPQILGPVPAPIFKIHGQYRSHLIIKTDRMNDLRSALYKLTDDFKKSLGEKSHLEIDFDAVDLL